MRFTVWDPSRKVNQLSKVIWDYNRVHQIYQFHQNRLEKFKFIIKKNEVAANVITHDHHLIKRLRVKTLDKLTSTKTYSILILKVQNKLSLNICFENWFNYDDIDGTAIYMLPRPLMHNTYIRSFQYKILNNIIYLNKKLHIFGIKSSPLCSFCSLSNETPFQIFYEGDGAKCLWSDLLQCFQNTLTLPTWTPQTAVLGILDSVSINSFSENNKIFINHILLIFKLYVYKCREKIFMNINNLIAEIRKLKDRKRNCFKQLNENNCF